MHSDGQTYRMSGSFKSLLTSAVPCILACVTAQHRHLQPLHYPHAVMGYEVATTPDSTFVKRFGKGIFTDQEGHLGGRYYVDPHLTVTLHIVLGVDRFVDEIEVSKGVHVPGFASSPQSAPVTSKLDPPAMRIGALKLGDSAASVLKRLGRPTQDSSLRGLRTVVFTTDYQRTRGISLYYKATFRFRGGKLISADIYDGE